MLPALRIGVCGASGSGKSTFAKLLKDSLNKRDVSVKYIAMDDYYKPEGTHKKITLASGTEYDNWDCPDAFQWDKFLKEVDLGCQQQVVLVEGLFTWPLRNTIGNSVSAWDMAIWIYVPDDIALARRVHRDPWAKDHMEYIRTAVFSQHDQTYAWAKPGLQSILNERGGDSGTDLSGLGLNGVVKDNARVLVVDGSGDLAQLGQGVERVGDAIVGALKEKTQQQGGE